MSPVCRAFFVPPSATTAQVLELKRRIFPQLLFRLRQVAHYEPAPDLLQLLVFLQSAILLQSLRHHATGGWRNVDADPLTLQLLCRD
jgi:hypothetical protein